MASSIGTTGLAPGNQPISTEQFTPGMLAAITKMLSDPKESWYVKAGALMALKLAPAKDIQERYKLIQPWIKHSDWWMREAAFMALSGLAKDDALYIKILPTLLTMATSENHTMPREWMMNHFEEALRDKKPESEAGKLIIAGMKKAVSATEIKSGVRSGEGAYNVMEAVKLCLQTDPTLAAALAIALQPRFADFSTDDLVDLVAAPCANPSGNPFGLFTAAGKTGPQTTRGSHRHALCRSIAPNFSSDFARTRTKKPKPDIAEHHHRSHKTQEPQRRLETDRQGATFGTHLAIQILRCHSRKKTSSPPAREDASATSPLPDDLKDWFKPEYDDSKWNQGARPSVPALYKQGDDLLCQSIRLGQRRIHRHAHDLRCRCPRLRFLPPEHPLPARIPRLPQRPRDRSLRLVAGQAPLRSLVARIRPDQHLKTGTNVIAVYSNVEYDETTKAPYGQVDCLIEGLKKSDLK